MDPESTKSLSRSQFGREANKYVSSQVHSSKADLEFVIELINPEPTWSVLDIATGTGHLALALSPSVLEIIASDITPEMIEKTNQQIDDRQLNNITTELVDVHDIPYDDNSFDLVTTRIAPHHFHDVRLAIEEMVRVLKPDGYLFIEDTVAPEDEKAADLFNRIERLRDKSHVRDLSPSEWISLLEDHGLDVTNHTLRQKNWPLRWWTERMSTPVEDVKRIVKLLEDNYERFGGQLHIKRKSPSQSGISDQIDQWSIHPHNGYFLAVNR